MHRLQKLLVVMLMLVCVTGIASAAYPVDLPTSFNNVVIQFTPNAYNSEVTLTTGITAGAEDVVISPAMISGDTAGTNFTVTFTKGSSSLFYEGGAGDVLSGAAPTLKAGETMTFKVVCTPASGSINITLSGTAANVSTISIAPIASTAGVLNLIGIPNTFSPVTLSTYDSSLNNNGPDDGRSLLEKATTTPTDRPTTAPTVEATTVVTAVPTTVVTTAATTVATTVATTAPPTATEAVVPLAGILAGLGAAAVVLRRK